MSKLPQMRPPDASADSESRLVLANAGSKARLSALVGKPSPKDEGSGEGVRDMVVRPWTSANAEALPLPLPRRSINAPKVLQRHHVLSRSNPSLNASCSSDCSMESFQSRASTGRIGGKASLGGRWKQGLQRPEKIVSRIVKVEPDFIPRSMPEVVQGKSRCPWITPNTEKFYATFHDEEWGVPVHDDKRLFELLVLSSALAELTWPVILSKRKLFREAFMDFDLELVSKLNEKRITAPGTIASSLLSEPKLRAVIENACRILKIIVEFGSFDRYCWSFVSHKPIISHFRYPRQVPVKTPKAEYISKDMLLPF